MSRSRARRQPGAAAILAAVTPRLVALNDPGLEPLLDDEWRFVDKGGDTSEGIIARRGWCPCREVYSVATNQTAFNQRPTAAQIAAACTPWPAPAGPEDECADDCVLVMTHVWHGWLLLRNRKTKKYLLNFSTFAQYHCKKPDDPDRDQPPKEGPPDPEL